MPQESTPSEERMVKASIGFYNREWEWVLKSAESFYGRRGVGMFIRKLVRDDMEKCRRVNGDVPEGIIGKLEDL